MLEEHPICDCGAVAVEVHHVISVRERPDLRLDVANLQYLCRSCHSRITARTQAFGRGMR
ncbi:HNH endonuclease [Ancylobacter polymorphus]|uniref:HNH endonuclease n=1 Tax=Ancylobacter polymorphus TaxID=223390 RepID=UPI003D769206